ncbi:NAD(P)-binding protein-21 [Coleophoma cylindrospora]|uniref:NAD(P)-binding protein-21 n=1 Tax=Coleophoma cylindrospora TaxID=1849047 RepID=A0A3D8QTD1_9HELO|nr:NAD(P)-binding protein-21 [Coleophoma cylindrospora]
MAMQVANKTAIITGAGSGINLCFARLLLNKGCNVLFADLSLRPEAEELVSRHSSAAGRAKAVFQKTDVTDWRQLERMFGTATKAFGGADIVCPGAGIYEPPWTNFWNPPGQGPSKDKIEDSRYALVDINITHPIRTTQLAISHFLAANKPGVVTHITSVAGQVPFFPTPVYVASKHAIQGFVRSLYRLEEPRGSLPKIRVNAVAPGLIKTPLWTDHPEKMKFIAEDDQGWVTPEDVAKVMLELVEGEEHVGGTILEVGKSVRKVETFMDPGPPSDKNAVHHSSSVEDDVWSDLGKQWKA